MAAVAPIVQSFSKTQMREIYAALAAQGFTQKSILVTGAGYTVSSTRNLDLLLDGPNHTQKKEKFYDFARKNGISVAE